MLENVDLINQFNLKGSILSISRTNDKVIVITQDYQAFVIDLETLSKKNLTQILASNNLPHKYAKNTSANNDFLCVCESCIITIATIAESILPFKQLAFHKNDVSATCFSQNGSYFVSGGEDGRIHICESGSFKKLITLPYMPDYISSINFSKDSRFLFVSCFNKSNIIFDCQRTKILSIFNTNEVVEWGDFFDNNSKLFMIVRNANTIIFDVKANKPLSIANPISSWPSIFCINDDESCAIVGTRDSQIYLIDLNHNSSILSFKASNTSGISALCIYMGYIFIGYTDGELKVLNYNDNDDSFKTACRHKDYKKAAELMDKNIFLSLLPCAKIFDEDWEGVLKNALVLLIEDKVDEALEIVAPFIKNQRRKETFDFYFNQHKQGTLKRFDKSIKNKSYKEAYDMILQYKFLAKTPSFEELENIWFKAFNTAKKILEENSAHIDMAKKQLESFAKTPKKETITQLLNNISIFKEAESLIKEQKFKEYFTLTSSFGYLKDTEVYKKVLLLGESIFNKAILCKNQSNYDEFNKLARFLQGFPMYKDIISSHIVSIAKKQEMLTLIKQNKKSEVYNLAMEFDELQYLEEFREYCKQFEDIYKEAKSIAFEGKPELLGDVFREYISINYWQSKIENTFKIAYLEEFKYAKYTDKGINWEQSVNNYIHIFGKDDDIVDFCVKNNLQTLLESSIDEAREPFRFQKSLLVR